MPKLLTITEVAEMLRTSPNTINYWIYKGTGPKSIKVGRRRLWSEADVLAWLEARREPVGA
ncbi:helix-turn-helix transcriptional regulator [Demequina gelatinilytica]|uniref:helix-turn-helix transcriptional regulator n=1 Tax=Demequina gelatinilytica TaxID=1638980 RepID=UPI000784F5AB|nr:helix-turn-helix domain-containing protein [Demequina gelatinilytica]